ncbi:hypothetical protein [Pedobacter sp. L105]|uniref:hypothetical protein n=1 Tax=Pedobacter sp. L105 TaxID=1641871 RepID=UPI00131CE310|nr:hypothetical protein [Pedobacter sp. L105]
MENLDLIAYTALVGISFAVFIVLTLKEFNYMNKNKFKSKTRNAGKTETLEQEPLLP